jgi:DNA-directed RNA polymerase I, II, and III subunit RPABC1
MFAHTRKLFTIRRTISKMLQRRGYTIPDTVLSETLPDFERAYLNAKQLQSKVSSGEKSGGESKRSKGKARKTPAATAAAEQGGGEEPAVDVMKPFTLAFTVARPAAANTPNTDASSRMMVFFPNDTDQTNIGISPIREFVNTMETNHCTRAILVVYDSLTAPAVLMLKDLELTGVFISFFAEQELLYDIYEHARVPRHVLLTPGEKQTLLHDMKVVEDLLPKIQKIDPMARYMGLEVGDVVRIERYSATTGSGVYYRVVVDSENFD